MEHTEAAQISALLGALGSLLVLIPRGRALPLLGFALLGAASLGIARSLVGDDDLRVLFDDPAGLALVAVAVAAVTLGAIPLVRYPTAVPVALLAAAPFRVPVEVGSEEAFLLLPLYLVLASSVLALAYRTLRNVELKPPPLLLALPVSALSAFTAVSFAWTQDEREGGVILAFFVFPFVAGLAVVARAPFAAWLPRALLATLVGLGVVFAAIGVWQVQTRTLFFARDLEVANAYTSFFRVTSLFKDPSLYGRYLVVPIVLLLAVLWLRRGRPVEWAAIAALIAVLFTGLFYSYSQSSFVALFVVTFAIALLGADRRLRIVLVACALAATLTAAALAADAVNGRSARDVTSGRSRLVSITIDVFETNPAVGVGVGGQPRASGEARGRRTGRRSASHTTPLTVLAELGLVGFVLYLWLLGACVWALFLVWRAQPLLAAGLGAVFLVLFVHSLLYAGFFEDPLTWGVFGLAAAALAPFARAHASTTATDSPRALAH